MSDAFRTKAQHFAQQVISDVKATIPETAPEQPVAIVQPEAIQVEATVNEPQAYHEESRLSEFGIFNLDFIENMFCKIFAIDVNRHKAH